MRRVPAALGPMSEAAHTEGVVVALSEVVHHAHTLLRLLQQLQPREGASVVQHLRQLYLVRARLNTRDRVQRHTDTLPDCTVNMFSKYMYMCSDLIGRQLAARDK